MAGPRIRRPGGGLIPGGGSLITPGGTPPREPPRPPDPPRPPISPPPGRAVADVFVVPRTLQEATLALLAAEQKLTSIEWRIGKLLIAIHDFQLFLETGKYDDFLEWLAAEGPSSVQNCRRQMYFARVFERRRRRR